MGESDSLAASDTTATGDRARLWLFTATIFVGATLLFLVQPLFAKMVLPLLGGAPSVWNTALVFFQAVLLAGYGYAHWLMRRFGQRKQIIVHVCVLAMAALVLPIGVASGWRPQVGTPPAVWLLGLLTVSVGPPFFAVSATAPLIQRWFARDRPSSCARPVFPLQREQSRQRARPVGVSVYS